MYADIKPPMPFEAVAVHSFEVVCDGGDAAIGHPRVFLHIPAEMGFIVCPYCSREYIYSPQEKPKG